MGYEFSILKFLATKKYKYQNDKSFIRLMFLIGESKNGAKDIHSSSGWTTTNATICLLQGLRG